MHPFPSRAISNEPACHTTLADPDNQRTLVAIPARWGSTRFPGKPLHLIAGKPLVQHVWERCQDCREVDDVIIATDDARIAEAAAAFGAKAVITSPDHPSGTDRIAEAAKSFPDHRFIINVQGDEPLISPALIDELAVVLRKEHQVRMITAAAPIHEAVQIDDPNIVKVVFDVHGDSLYFSRSPLPFVRNATAGVRHYRHLGIYGFQRSFLFQFVAWSPSRLEITESLEQLRAVENGVRLRVVLTDELSPGVDTPEQAEAIERHLQGRS
ncbi:MAG: 3-deoxy-manno-octulosonate cytidylyltransferase [Prosthecobacter sp.]|nr:3-deoxy-manno-octulosonate cytidylyltransferase [Prosthecobacter sp.]